ncbi:hypothetical protein OE88DRAFT_1649663 [Heliocybe sulcata]|uniref:Uncharacterized protein n=1 Tax=Heliocybe sulcata TaxID=5364 RepID=A0A5C3NRR5_9AGAM|nr:hypothetical protein OE88DRAFT_1649663 [Heliocybe sulcata]
MHALRLWYMFSHNQHVQWVIVALSVAYGIAEFAIVGLWLQDKGSQYANGRLWISPLIVHTVLYAMTILRAVFFKPASGDARAVMNRILKDGFLFFSASFASTAFATIGALQSNTLISTPARYTQFFLVMTSIAMSRLMLSIHSLSASLGTESEWLLSHLEMSRMHFRQGSRDGELIVDVDNVGNNDYELTNAEDLSYLGSTSTILECVPKTPTETITTREGGEYDISVVKREFGSDTSCA